MATTRKAKEIPAAPFLLLIIVSAITALHLVPTLTAAQSSSSDCTDVLIRLAPCLDYITRDSSAPPSSSCCSQFASVVNTQPRCLCEAIGGDSGNGGGVAAAMGVNINRTRALDLPKACNVQTPPVSRCNGGVTPQSRSHSAITPTSTSSSSSSPSEAGIGGSKTLPARQPQDSSDGQVPAPSAVLFLASLFFISHSVWNVILNGFIYH